VQKREITKNKMSLETQVKTKHYVGMGGKIQTPRRQNLKLPPVLESWNLRFVLDIFSEFVDFRCRVAMSGIERCVADCAVVEKRILLSWVSP